MDIGALLGACLTLWWRGWSWRAGTASIAITATVFIIWDIAATAAGHWHFNPNFTLGWLIAGLPIEEWLFFIAIPLVAIAAWELCRTDQKNVWSRRWLLLPAVLAIIMLTTWPERGYSVVVSLATLLMAGTLALLPALRTLQFLKTLGVIFILFAIFNTILTALPVVTYGQAHFSGIRLGTIPLEDAFYNFALTVHVMAAYIYLKQKTRQK